MHTTRLIAVGICYKTILRFWIFIYLKQKPRGCQWKKRAKQHVGHYGNVGEPSYPVLKAADERAFHFHGCKQQKRVAGCRISIEEQYLPQTGSGLLISHGQREAVINQTMWYWWTATANYKQSMSRFALGKQSVLHCKTLAVWRGKAL